MDLEYDMKFEEMKKYIPFLENMIKRLESNSSSSANPRQAQLDKIRSLRDLLLDKKKRMKMENLLKCEQVLVNLYAKVEQRGDTLPGIEPASEVIKPNSKSDLNLARNKLKTVANKSHDPDTLPEIARASETEVVCVPGSKEPALFQRRPNKSSLSPTKHSSSEKSPQKSSSKRNYTRVLLSPERSNRGWSASKEPASDQPLFSRRSPPRQSRRYSPSHHKRERKKSSKQESHSRKPKDLNITLKVPEESLNSLNTKDIVSRIINCSDGDVDITTLRELRTQILGELKQTGANEDISDLILKSYKNKKRRNKKDDVEEGELSDSESEAIESIYGNLVVVEKDKGKDTSSNHNKLNQDKVPRKIQICLVINSDKEEDTSSNSNKNGGEKQKICDITDFEMFDDGVGSKDSDPSSSVKDKGGISSLKTKKLTSPSEANHNKSQEIITIDDVDKVREQSVTKEPSCGVIDMNNFDLQADSNSSKTQEVSTVLKTDSTPFKANFYKPLVEPAEATNANNKNKSFEESVDIGVPVSKSVEKQGIHVANTTDKSELEKHTSSQISATGKDTDVSNEVSKIMDSMKNKFATGNIVTEPEKSSPDTVTTDKDQEIPLLNEPTVKPATKDVVSEIDILQALKNEILSETIAIPCAEVATPALHQPKITKVSNVQELPKKRISIENYKQKTVKPNKTSLFVNDPSIALSKEESRKQSLKLTEKEVERFNLISKIALNDSSDDDDNYESIKSPDGIDFAPKSPDIDFTKDVSVSPPVIIPVDPVKTAIVSSKTDVDMRKIPNMSPTPLVPFGPTLSTEPRKNDIPEPRNPVKTDPKWPAPPVDPRVRRDKDALLPTPLMGFPNATPTRTPNMTPSRTPTRVPNIQSNAKSFEMTPSRPFEMDEVVQKHVYAPMFHTQENTGERTPIWEPPEPSPVNKSVWEAPGQVPVSDRDPTSARKWDDRDPRSSYSHRDDGHRSRYSDSQYESSNNRTRNDRFSSREDYTRQDGPRPPSFYGRSECPATPTPSFGRDAPATPSHYFGRSEGSMTPSHPFGRSEVPLTPSHPFGRSEAPLTPSHPFGRSEPPLTPSHPFGRTDAPSTPSHPFGRSEAPSTPIHPFGRSEAPSTPSHPFGRSEAPMTPSHPFGRSDYSYNNQTSKYGKPQDPRLNRSYDSDSSSRSDRTSYNDRYRYIRNDPRNSSREQKEERNDKNPYTPDQSYNREHLSRREHSVGHSLPKDNERDGHYSRNTKQGPDNSRSYAEVGSRRTAHREESIGRPMPDQRSRASSIGRTFGKPQNNKLSVESHAGRAFTIDTSVNSTFQKLIDSHRSNDSSSFDIRRQRASSVGRSLTRESSIGRMLPNNLPHHTEQSSSRNKFIRAQSVGRDLSRAQSVGRDLTKTEKSFKDIKAEFERYRRTENTFKSESTIPSRTNENFSNRDPRRRDSYDKQQDSNRDPRRRDNNDKQQDSNRDPRRRDSYDKLQDNRDPRRRDSFDKQQDRTHWNKTNSKETTVPAKKFNYRDPRQRKEQQRLQSRFDDRNDKNRSNSRDRHSYGISSDTVIKSPVINSVKNYKIPKIKRAPEEKPEVEVAPVEVVPVKVDAKETSARQKIEKSTKTKCATVTNKVEKVSKSEKKTVADKISKKEVRDDKSKITVEKTEKRVTRQSGRKNEINKSMNESEDEEIGFKTRKFKKVIYHSDSDGNGDDIKVTSKIESPKKLPVAKNKDESTHCNENNVTEEPKLNEQKTSEIEKNKELDENQEALDSSFGLDDIDLFSDNIITDPVLDNINALIADLDNDLDAPKGGSACNDLFNEISIENMLEKITTSPTKPETCKTAQSPDITTVKKDLFDSLKESANSDPTDYDKSVISTKDNAEKKENSNLTNIDQLKDKKTETEETPNTTCLDEVRNVDSIEEKYDLPEPNKAQSEVISRPDDTNDPEAVVSTSVNEDETPNKDISADCVKLDGRSTPDSTNDAEVVTKNSSDIERKPDSTAEKQCEMNSDISSTHDTVDKVSKESNEVNEPATQIESIGNLLSMLQDKSKIKELLNMLGGQSSENEKIKKKLEKLSEIVSDDEDINEVNVEVETEKGKALSEDKVEIENEKNDNEQESKTENAATEDSMDINKLADIKESYQVKQIENVQDKNNIMPETDEEPQSPSPVKKIPGKVLKRFKNRKIKRGKVNRPSEVKRVTRSEAAVLQFKPGPSKKKPSRELKQLQESIKEMFMSEDILNASGIRMCRLAKMVDDKKSSQNDEVSSIDVSEPVVVLEKVKHIDVKDGNIKEKPMRKKPGPKPKVKSDVISPNEKKVIEEEKPFAKYKPGPKSKTRIIQEDKDPYDFETDSLNDSKASDKALDNSSESDDESLASSKSYESSELLVELKKKPKRKRKFWQAGVIKPKNKKRKIETKRAESPPSEPAPETERKISIPDHNCFTDKKYCFSKHLSEYSCRLCESTHSAADIVFHYKKRHPHSEIPLSRMSPEIAKEAIEQCEEINFQAISKIPTEKYTCRFCYKEFAKKKASLEAFFWHVVSMHTGEYKQLCSECINEKRCPFNLDIPPPPKDIKGQLIGFICGKCNFTQISLENLKTHVIVRHNDEQTAVYTINFAVMTKKTINSLAKRCVENQPRVTRSSRSNQSLTEPSDDRSDITESEPELAKVGKKPGAPVEDSPNFSFKSKINFETDEYGSDISNIANTDDTAVKVERDDEEDNQQDTQFDEPDDTPSGDEEAEKSDTIQAASDDVMDYPHFKIRYTDTGNKEYVCCINGTDNHYKTGLLISMKKHVQLKHTENWDGYCFVCKVIVTPQGQHKFSECLLHFLDKHIDDFPVYEKEAETVKPLESPEPPVRSSTPKSYINVRPLADLLVKTFEAPLEKPVETPVDTRIEALVKTSEALPVIENVVSLLPSTVEPPRPSPTYPVTRKEDEPPKEYNYEEAQAEVMSKKHRVVLDVMMAPAKLVQVFKCAGRFCSFTTYSAEAALVHASTHQRVGGTNALLCSYCDFDSSGNAIDLVSHVFKSHGSCQFVCGLCFYRAAASQLVGAHIARVHQVTPGPGAVLKASNAPPRRDLTAGHLTREVAVPLYICKQNDREGACSFRTVTHTKFWEHLTQRHPEATGFNCYICALVSDNATGLVLHLKTHGLKLYHCTRCVFGADTEQELLAHCSAKHPSEPPLAYIRTICGMSGNGSFKILPLVELKKAALPSDEVAADKITENPVREAERSIELEKLIGHLSELEEPAASPATTAPAAPTDDSARVTEIPDRLSTEIDNIVPNPLEGPTLDPMATLIPVPSLVPMEASTPVPPITPPPPVDQDLSKQLTPVLKEEPKDTTPEKAGSDDVICLDSDDEDSKQGIISLSDDETANTSQPGVSQELKQLLTDKKITNLLKCDKCSMVCSTIAGFKKHLFSCYAKGTGLKCAHCGHPVETIDALLTHYSQSHGLPTRYSCGLCQRSEVTLSAVKRHVKQSHNVNKLVVTTSSANLGEIIVTGKPGPAKAGRAARRKPSAGAPVTPTKRRFGPSEIDKLPINPIMDEPVHCEICEFHTKVRLNMVRHLQQHLEQQPVAQTAPVNPVPHLETNEKHFDKMVNLASSSAAARAADRPAREPALLLPPAVAARYPKFVPERQRLACGARGCAYISLDEGMLRRHWETLHPGTTDYHCVHCPPHQHLDKSKPLTASRIIGHLKMHDARLYACSVCPYYHYKRQVLEKHLAEMHRSGTVVVVREDTAPPPPPAPAAAAPTMDLKPWQCGLCEFKSMLRPEVVDHCSKLHQSKMQYKCAYCPFRTSMPENVTKHQTSSHPNREQEIFYFYYREGSMPDAADGTPHWQKQRQKIGLGPTQEVKAEIADTTIQSTGTILPQIRPPAAHANVNLNLVKQEVDPDLNSVLETVEDLCKKFGEFCEPNGLNYKCSLCKVVVEDSKLAMQSHLFEELQYRKWGCRLCSYKAFHQTGLKEHMWTEHRQNQEPIELPVDVNVEAWVSKLLDHQEDLIKKNRDKLAQQKIQVERVSAPAPSRTVEMSNTSAKKLTVEELEKAFGPLGAASNMMFVCPKCKFQTKEEVAMQDHLELVELTRIRWCCSNCPNNFTTYHEAQFHCKSTHAGQAARPVEAPRDPSVRAAWVSAVISTQRLSFKTSAAAPTLTQSSNLQPDNESNDSEENSLLVIRYEENVPTPEEETLRRKRAASTAPDSDDENLVIDETQKRGKKTDCPHCTFTTKYKQIMTAHILRHYNLKPFTCPYCEFNSNKAGVLQHIASKHSDKRAFANRTEKPLGPPTILDLSKPQKKLMAPAKKVDDTVCLTCEKVFSDSEAKLHVHGKDIPKFGKKGQVVVKCCECFLLLPDVVSMHQHNAADHPSTPINYAYYKLLHDTRDFVLCSHCNQRFPHLIDLKSHHNAVHSSLKLMYKNSPYIPYAKTENTESEANCLKRKADAQEGTSGSSLKRVAKKSTTKLPCSQSIAKKSTTKLPFYVDSDSESELEEYSYYGTKPSAWENFANVTTLMPFYNTMVPFTLKKLREIISIDPKVVVKDVKK